MRRRTFTSYIVWIPIKNTKRHSIPWNSSITLTTVCIVWWTRKKLFSRFPKFRNPIHRAAIKIELRLKETAKLAEGVKNLSFRRMRFHHRTVEEPCRFPFPFSSLKEEKRREPDRHASAREKKRCRGRRIKNGRGRRKRADNNGGGWKGGQMLVREVAFA